MIGMPSIPNFKGLVSSGLDAAISFGGAALINTVFGNYWGIFSQFGTPILLADNVLSLSYSNTSSITNAPVEKGSFASYNKVQDPFKATVQLSKSSGGAIERGLFLAQIDALSKSTLTFYIITPEYVYRNAAITGYDLARDASDGMTLIKVNIHLEEVREVVVSYEDEEVKNPDNAENKDGGDKQSKEAGKDSPIYTKDTTSVLQGTVGGGFGGGLAEIQNRAKDVRLWN